MPGALLTDLYELNMAASYLRRDMTGPATFSLYVRNLPPNRGFLVAAGLQACLDALESFSFDEDELGYLRTIGFDEQDVEAFRGVRFDGEVWAVAEGRIVHAGEPIMEITASLPAAQLVETLLLNQVTLHTTVATKAARYRAGAPGKDLVDFAFRRTHGRDAAMAVARSSAIVGFAATSNVEAARRTASCRRNDGALVHRGVPVGDRRVPRVSRRTTPSARRSWSTRTTRCTGSRRRSRSFSRCSSPGGSASGWTAAICWRLARGARKLLDDAGLTQVRIFASGGLDELEVAELVRAGRRWTRSGSGRRWVCRPTRRSWTRCTSSSTFDGRPVLKLSPARRRAPGRKQVWRGRAEGDVLALRDEPGVTGAEPLLEPVMRDGVRPGSAPSLEGMRARFDADLVALPDGARLLVATPEPSRFGIRMRSSRSRLRRGTTRCLRRSRRRRTTEG